MSTTTSPNMNLILPTVGQEPGPAWASDLNASLTLIDQHDHTPGNGVQITPAGINIDIDLTLNDNSLTNAITIVFTADTSASVTPQSLSVAPGGESPQQQDLWYTPNTGVPIQITKNGAVNTAAASIDGESYASGTFFWTQAQDSLPTTPANFDIGSVTLRPNVALTSFGVVLQPASAIASQYSINLPLLPVSKKIVTLNSSGDMVADYDVDNSTIEVSAGTIQVKNQGITAAKILNNTITTSQISLTAGITQDQLAAAAFNWTADELAPVVASFAVRVATTVNGTFTTAFDNGSTVDGVVLATGNIILIKNQTNPAENGVYDVQASGSPVRNTSYDTFTELNYAGVTVTLGTVNAGTSWFQNNILTSLSDAQSWSRSSNQAYVVPAGVNFLHILMWAGGGGAGSGARFSGTTTGAGAGGGIGGGGAEPRLVSVSVTPGQSLDALLGAGGLGGAGKSAVSSNSGTAGNAGSDGSNTVIVGTGVTLTSSGGLGGAAGAPTNATSSDNGPTWAILGSSTLGGAGGAGASSGNAAAAGSVGGISQYQSDTSSGGAASGTSGVRANGGGGGGGGSSMDAGGDGSAGNSGAASSAGTAGSRGSGGGGSGGGTNNSGLTSTSGAGGNGGNGGAIIFYQVGG